MRRIALALALAVLGVVTSPACEFAAGKGQVPSNFVRHVNHPWVWYGPHSWVASASNNGIDITSPVGDDYVGFGFAGIQCPSAATAKQAAAQWFRALRRYDQQHGSYDSKPLKSSHYTKVGTVKHLAARYYGPYGYRQTDTWTGKRKNGDAVRGEIVLDFYYDPNTNSCGEASQVRSAPAARYAGMIKTLRTIQSTITYQPSG